MDFTCPQLNYRTMEAYSLDIDAIDIESRSIYCCSPIDLHDEIKQSVNNLQLAIKVNGRNVLSNNDCSWPNFTAASCSVRAQRMSSARRSIAIYNLPIVSVSLHSIVQHYRIVIQITIFILRSSWGYLFRESQLPRNILGISWGGRGCRKWNNCFIFIYKSLCIDSLSQ